jgi:membrane-associated phospholipid phosphatase
LLGTAQTLWWLFIFRGADWLTSRHDFRVRIHCDAELNIPFVPAMVLGYLSINGLFLLAPFVLRSRRELNGLMVSMATVILVAGICFVLIPSEPAFPDRSETSQEHLLGMLLIGAKQVALRHNMVPSLHVALSALCALAFATRAWTLGKALLTIWVGLIALSTLLIHQHHVVDVVTGFALAWAGKRFIYDHWLQPKPTATGPDMAAG